MKEGHRGTQRDTEGDKGRQRETEGDRGRQREAAGRQREPSFIFVQFYIYKGVSPKG